MTNSDVRAVTLAECPIGLFVCGDELCLKTEYGNNEGRIDAYIVSSGEFFWGHRPQSISNQRQTLVSPVDATSVHLSPPAMDREVLRQVGRKLMAIEDTVPIAKEAQAIIMDALAGTGGGVPEDMATQEPADAAGEAIAQIAFKLREVASPLHDHAQEGERTFLHHHKIAHTAANEIDELASDLEDAIAALKRSSPTPTSPDESRSTEGELAEALANILNNTHVGKRGSAVSAKSKYGNYPARYYHAGVAALRTHRGGEK